jgi:hypothetical protein
MLAAAGLGVAMLLSGCKSTPELTAAQAQTLIQAKYDSAPPAGASIRVDELGILQGHTAKYWDRTKEYPNKYWADFTLTADGKKAVTLPGGGDVIQWRPDSAADKSFAVTVTTVATNHLKARDVKDPQDQSDGTKTCSYEEAVNLDGVPAPLADIAHNPGNTLAEHRTATFTLDGGKWKLSSTN